MSRLPDRIVTGLRSHSDAPTWIGSYLWTPRTSVASLPGPPSRGTEHIWSSTADHRSKLFLKATEHVAKGYDELLDPFHL